MGALTPADARRPVQKPDRSRTVLSRRTRLFDGRCSCCRRRPPPAVRGGSVCVGARGRTSVLERGSARTAAHPRRRAPGAERRWRPRRDSTFDAALLASPQRQPIELVRPRLEDAGRGAGQGPAGHGQRTRGGIANLIGHLISSRPARDRHRHTIKALRVCASDPCPETLRPRAWRARDDRRVGRQGGRRRPIQAGAPSRPATRSSNAPSARSQAPARGLSR